MGTWLTDLSSDFLSLMRKRIWKWTNERPEYDNTDWSSTCCYPCVILYKSVCIANSVFFHSRSVLSPWFWSGNRSDLSVLCSPLCSWSSCSTLHRCVLDVSVPRSCLCSERGGSAYHSCDCSVLIKLKDSMPLYRQGEFYNSSLLQLGFYFIFF